MYIFERIILICFIFFINNCSFNNLEKIEQKNNYSVQIETPNDKYNTYFKESLKRLFYQKNDNKEFYVLKASITFQSTETLSVGGTNVLKSTKAKINYQLENKNTNKILKSGSITTFPALSSSSTSLYSQEKGIDHIKERLIKSAVKSLYMHINIIMRKLS
mgnify:FL=1